MSTGLLIEPAPFQTRLVEKDGGMHPAWSTWFELALLKRLQQAAVAVVSVALTAQTASIGTTSLIPLAAAGVYRVSYRLRVVTAAGTNSSITVTIRTTEGLIACAQTSAALTANATNVPLSGAFIVRSDAASPLAYSTTYASSGSPVMAYDLDLVVEQIA